MEFIDRLALIPDPKLHVAVLTGTGISAESGEGYRGRPPYLWFTSQIEWI